MIRQRSSRIPLETLILCLCLGGLVISPMFGIIRVSVPGIYGIDLENYNLLEQIEFDEEFLIDAIHGLALVGLFFLKFKPMHLDFRTACLSPIAPPPKRS